MPIAVRIGGFEGNVDQHPGKCPRCHALVQALPVYGHVPMGDGFPNLEIAYLCMNTSCNRMFLGQFHGPFDIALRTRGYVLGMVAPQDHEVREFSETIATLSDSFVLIYNEAFAAEQDNLMQICGVGYRKALEFLIKDYIIRLDPGEEIAIKSKLIGRCIDDHVKSDRIRAVAKRAVWLGNDETHYVRKWEDKDLTDLKRLIDLTVHWIESEELTKDALESMPDPSVKFKVVG